MQLDQQTFILVFNRFFSDVKCARLLGFHKIGRNLVFGCVLLILNFCLFIFGAKPGTTHNQ